MCKPRPEPPALTVGKFAGGGGYGAVTPLSTDKRALAPGDEEITGDEEGVDNEVPSSLLAP